ncbi:MAG: T9SS type A sorting domain-containing protein [Saprospiraceae bacterium]|nr:T9SS type A sorting domain-containing protein [Saprospiraceae bacterium]
MRILLYLGFICAFILFISSSNGRAANGSGNTGAPGDEMVGSTSITCKFCHTGNSIVTNTSILILDADSVQVNSYVPGADYTIRVSVNTSTGSPKGYGFQLIGIKDADSLDVKGFSSPSINTKLATTSFNNRTYAEHKRADSLNTFEVKWKAPAQGTGNVSFYAAGNGVNKNSSSDGDGASNTKMTLSEAVVLSSNSKEHFSQKVQIFPNPITEGKVFIQWAEDIEIDNYTLINAKGRIIQSGELEDLQKSTIDVSNQTPGIYFLKLETKQSNSNPIVKTIMIH